MWGEVRASFSRPTLSWGRDVDFGLGVVSWESWGPRALPSVCEAESPHQERKPSGLLPSNPHQALVSWNTSVPQMLVIVPALRARAQKFCLREEAGEASHEVVGVQTQGLLARAVSPWGTWLAQWWSAGP